MMMMMMISYTNMEALFMRVHKMEAQHFGKVGEDVLIQDFKTSTESGYKSILVNQLK